MLLQRSEWSWTKRSSLEYPNNYVNLQYHLQAKIFRLLSKMIWLANLHSVQVALMVKSNSSVLRKLLLLAGSPPATRTTGRLLWSLDWYIVQECLYLKEKQKKIVIRTYKLNKVLKLLIIIFFVIAWKVKKNTQYI